MYFVKGQWLTYIKWYYTVAWSQDPSFLDFFDAPIVERRWRASSLLFRFGLMWKLYDNVASADPYLYRYALTEGSLKPSETIENGPHPEDLMLLVCKGKKEEGVATHSRMGAEKQQFL